MGASVISFRSLLGQGRSKETVPGPWTNQELAELYRISDLLGRAGMTVGTDSGVSDENEPWFVFFTPDGDVIAHFARIGGVYIAAAGQDKPLRGTCFRDLVQKIMDCEPLVLPQPRNRSGKVTNLYLHPVVVLTAFVATALLCSRKSMAAPEAEEDAGGRRVGRAGDGAAGNGATGGQGSGTASQADGAHLAAGPNFLTALQGQSTAVTFASAAALISTVLKTEDAAARAAAEGILLPDGGAAAGLLLDSGRYGAVEAADGEGAVAAPAVDDIGSQVRVSVGGGEAKAAGLFVIGPEAAAMPVGAILGGDGRAGWGTGPWLTDGAPGFGSAADHLVLADLPAATSPAPATSPAAAIVPAAQPQAVEQEAASDHGLAAASAAAPRKAMPTPAAAVAARETAAKTTEESHVVVDLRADNVLLPSHKGQFTLISFIVPGTAEVKDAEAAPVATAPAVPADVAEPDKGDAAVPEAEPLTVDGRYDVVLGEGTQMIYFGGGTSVVKGFVAGEDILLVDPALLEGPWEVTVPVNEGTAVLSFTDGSLLILQDLVLGAAYLTGA